MAKMTPARRRLARRRPDGTFKTWPGGRRKADLRLKEQTFQGIAAHIGAGFKRERGRVAKTGDIYRTRTSSGAFHRLAYWYIKTPHGWRKSPTQVRRPSPAVIRRVCANARPGRAGHAGPG